MADIIRLLSNSKMTIGPAKASGLGVVFLTLIIVLAMLLS